MTISCPEWASSDRSSVVQWSNTNTGSSIFHDIQLQSRPHNGQVENRNQAQDGTVYYAMSTVGSIHNVHVPVDFGSTPVHWQSQPGISWQINLADTVRDQFQTDGKLTNTASTTFAPISP